MKILLDKNIESFNNICQSRICKSHKSKILCVLRTDFLRLYFMFLDRPNTKKRGKTMRKLLLVIFTSLLFGVFVNAQTTPTKTASTDDKMETKARKKSFRPAKSQIMSAQEKLKAAGTYKGVADGKYNDDFRAALKQYQSANALDSNGKLDEETVVKMGIELTDSQKGIESVGSASDKTKRVSFRPTKEQISAAQKMLKGKGYNGEESGKYDDDLRTAIRDYQSANGLKRSGSLNRATLEKMSIELTESQMEIPANPDDLASADNTGGEKKKRGAVFRATKEQVTAVQQKLKVAKLYYI